MKTLTPRAVLIASADLLGVDSRDVTGGRRDNKTAFARGLAVSVLRQTLDMSFPKCAAVVSPDAEGHSTALSACRRVERQVVRNEDITFGLVNASARELRDELIERLELSYAW